ncbi:MAG TPA: site-specific DNA-methyltransferase [Candidatus Saccharimonadales bacterium]|nr:site-specific DNA-methyltransferase [Candidatus Saccharimonadales bacterium]
MAQKTRAGRNRTIDLSPDEKPLYRKHIIQLTEPVEIGKITNKTICQDVSTAIELLPASFVDLMIIDPPYNLQKTYNSNTFKKMDLKDYASWVDGWLSKMIRVLKPDASIYVCCDWQSSSAIYEVLNKYFYVRNRITWEREKGRGSKTNWKNCSEDIWYATNSKNCKFYPERVMIKRKVIAPYKVDGVPKDWQETKNGNFRMTHPSNLWTDISVPFWSMPENTDHPAQKPEKLIAKLILASSDEGDFVFDPFLGSGTTSVVAKKLKRKYAGIEIDEHYSLLAEKRLKAVGHDKAIQGYHDGVFWERNSLNAQKQSAKKLKSATQKATL